MVGMIRQEVKAFEQVDIEGAVVCTRVCRALGGNAAFLPIPVMPPDLENERR